jgi:trimeric autotransporter adhesin
MRSLLRALIITLSAMAALQCSEHHGLVTFHGLPVPGAVITAIQGDNKFTTSTDEDGAYSFPNLSDGTWTVEVLMTGFAKTSREIGVGAGAPSPTWDLKLAPPSGTKTTAGAPPGGRGGPQLTPAQAQAAGKERAAAQSRAQDQAQSRAAAVAATGGGGGGDAVLAGSVGGGGGGISVGNAVAGSQYNGNASFSLDNSVWDAIPYSVTGIHTPKAAFAKGRIGIAFGGPLKIPHLLDGKSSTFTVNYNLGRTRNATTSYSTVPTALERIGDFSQSVLPGTATILDPTTGQPFPGNKIPTNKLSGIALAMANYYPLPNSSASQLNYQTALVNISNSDNLNARLNETLGKKDRLSGGVGWNRNSNVTPNIFSFIDSAAGYGVNSNVSWSHTFSKRLIQNLNVNFSRSRNRLTPYFASLHQDVARQLGIQGTSLLPQDWGPPNLSFTNFSGLTDGTASLSRNQNVGFNYNLNFNRARHQWGIGTNYNRQQSDPVSDANGRGAFTFTGTVAGASAASGFDFADFLLNLPAAASVRFGNADKYLRNHRFGLFVQDNWTVSKVLSANFGLRWDYTSPFTELYNRIANLDISPGFTDAKVVIAGQDGPYSGRLPGSLVKHEYDGFSPSFGLAWRPFPKNTKSPTVVRVSFYQSRTIDGYTSIANNLSGQPPFAKVLNIAGSPSSPLTMQTAFLNSPVTANSYAVDPNYRMVVLTQMQMMITRSWKGYYGSGGLFYIAATHLDQTSLPNSLAPGLPIPVNGPLAGYTYEQSNGSLRGVQEYFQFGRNMASGLSASVYGQLARATENGALGALGGSGTIAQNWQDLNAERSTSTLLGRGSINGNWQYSTGQGKAGGTLVKGRWGALLKDWTFTNSVNFRAGLPLTATVASAPAGGTGITGTLRADATGQNVAAPAGSGESFNLAAFAVPASGHWGTAGRGTIIGPALWSLNGSLGRVFRLGERRSADLRFDANNFLNHVVVSGWGTVVNGFNYGLPTGTQAMRSMTANLRVRF